MGGFAARKALQVIVYLTYKKRTFIKGCVILGRGPLENSRNLY